MHYTLRVEPLEGGEGFTAEVDVIRIGTQVATSVKSNRKLSADETTALVVALHAALRRDGIPINDEAPQVTRDLNEVRRFLGGAKG